MAGLGPGQTLLGDFPRVRWDTPASEGGMGPMPGPDVRRREEWEEHEEEGSSSSRSRSRRSSSRISSRSRRSSSRKYDQEDQEEEDQEEEEEQQQQQEEEDDTPARAAFSSQHFAHLSQVARGEAARAVFDRGALGREGGARNGSSFGKPGFRALSGLWEGRSVKLHPQFRRIQWYGFRTFFLDVSFVLGQRT